MHSAGNICSVSGECDGTGRAHPVKHIGEFGINVLYVLCLLDFMFNKKTKKMKNSEIVNIYYEYTFQELIPFFKKEFLKQCHSPESLSIVLNSDILESLYSVSYKSAYLYVAAVNKYAKISGKKVTKDICLLFLEQSVNETQNLRKIQEDIIRQYVKNSVTLLQNFASIGYDVKNIASISFGAGDTHRGGKSVAIITLKDSRKLVYKPRNINIDVQFAKLFEVVEKDLAMGFKTARIIAKGEEFGFFEYIPYEECQDDDEVNLYYRRLGGILCLLYVLDATDFHYENIISKGGYPYLIDLESFFHPYFPIMGVGANQALDKSILRVGILPTSVNDDFEISGVADVQNMKSPILNQDFKYSSKGEVLLERNQRLLEGGKNVPLLNGKKQLLDKKRINFLTEGFKEVYHYVLKNREKFVIWLANCKYSEIRVLFRNTANYVHLLNESTHPDILKSETTYKFFFEKWLSAVKKDFPPIEKIIKYEVNDLENRNIPMFTTKLNSKKL